MGNPTDKDTTTPTADEHDAANGGENGDDAKKKKKKEEKIDVEELIKEDDKPIAVLDEDDIALLKSYGLGPYTTRIKVPYGLMADDGF